MATNRIYEQARWLYLNVPENTESGDAVAVGSMPGVAITDRDDDGKATVDLGGAYKLEVTAEDGDGTSDKVEVGDKLYFEDGTINKDDAQTLYGYALEEVDGGEEKEIAVKIGY